MIKNTVYAILGAGNIGRILIARLQAVGVPAEQILVCDTDLTRMESAAQDFQVRSMPVSEPATCPANVFLLTTPPTAIPAALAQLTAILTPEHLVISFAASFSLARLQALLPSGVNVARIMPNAPSLVGQGMNPVTYGPATAPEAKAQVEFVLQALGKTIEARDEQMNWNVGLSGASMRSLLPVLEGMTQAGLEAGFTQADARYIAAQVMQGVAALVLHTSLTFDEIKALTPMQTVNEAAMADLFLQAARSTKEKVEMNEHRLIQRQPRP